MALGWSLQGALGFGGVQQVPWHGSIAILGQMCCLLSPMEAGRRAGAARYCPSPATQTPGDRLGEPWLMLPAAYQGCLLTVYCLEWQYSAYGFATSSLWFLSTSLALAQHYGQNNVSKIEELIWLLEKKALWESTFILTRELLTWMVSQSRSGQGPLSSCASTSREQRAMMEGWEWEERLGVERCQWHLKLVKLEPQSHTFTSQKEVEQNESQLFCIFMSCSEHTFY